MTKERVQKVLKENLEWQNYTDGNDSWDTELKEAVTEAIKLIEQQPSDETIKYLECNDIDVQEFTEAMKKQRLQPLPKAYEEKRGSEK